MRKIFSLLMLLLTSLATTAHAVELKPGSPAPDFTAKDDQGKTVSLRDYRGKAVVLYFYPKDDSPGCTVEAIDFRDHYDEFKNLNDVVLGVSFDSQESHQKFREKFKLPFPLLVDTDRKIAEAYGVKGIFFASRDVIVIDDKGKVMKVLRGVDPAKAVGILLKDAQ